MAIFEKEIKDGIQLGHALDYCWKCHRPGSTIDNQGKLEYKEVFKIHVNGLEYCLCLDHFKQLLSDYELVHKDTLIKSDDVITIPQELAKNGTEKEVLDYIKKAIK